MTILYLYLTLSWVLLWPSQNPPYAVASSRLNQRFQWNYYHCFLNTKALSIINCPSLTPGRVQYDTVRQTDFVLFSDFISILRQERVCTRREHFIISMCIRTSRYSTCIDSLDDFLSRTNGLFVSGCLKSTWNKLRSFGLYQKHLGFATFLSCLMSAADSFWRLNIIFAKSFTIRIRRNHCRISIFNQVSAKSGVNRNIFISYCILHGKVMYLLWQFWLLFVSDVTRFEIFTSRSHICATWCCCYMLWKLPFGIKLNRGGENFYLFWFL